MLYLIASLIFWRRGFVYTHCTCKETDGVLCLLGKDCDAILVNTLFKQEGYVPCTMTWSFGGLRCICSIGQILKKMKRGAQNTAHQ
mmetsp:Transcript_34272/g.55331  ORF Transcript_34272/g.55331 Transcript_34272/m.55331 type:complete len:86 (+) Transcript_34272:145-402(+)